MDPRYNLQFTDTDGDKHNIEVMSYYIFYSVKGPKLGFLLPSGERKIIFIKSYHGCLLKPFQRRNKYEWGKTDTLMGIAKGQEIVVPFRSESNYNSWAKIARRLHHESVNPLTDKAELDWLVRSNRSKDIITIKRIL